MLLYSFNCVVSQLIVFVFIFVCEDNTIVSLFILNNL